MAFTPIFLARLVVEPIDGALQLSDGSAYLEVITVNIRKKNKNWVWPMHAHFANRPISIQEAEARSTPLKAIRLLVNSYHVAELNLAKQLEHTSNQKQLLLEAYQVATAYHAAAKES